MEPKKLIVCPAYLVTDAQNGAIITISSMGTEWFPVYHMPELAEEFVEQSGGSCAIKTVTEEEELRTILKSHPQIAGFLVNNPAAPKLFSPVTRQAMLGGSR